MFIRSLATSYPFVDTHKFCYSLLDDLLLKKATDKTNTIGGKNMAVNNYLRLYNLEGFLFDEVTKRFQINRTLTAFDFFCIVIWKANRSKSRVAARLMAQGQPDLDAAVNALLAEVAAADDNKKRLKVFIETWGFRLPMASAVLTVLYPDDFTVYDIRVCELLGDFKDAQDKTQFEVLWSRYSQYVAAVQAAVTDPLCLRDKDRYLWGKSFASQLKKDIAAQFKKPEEDAEFEA